MKVYKEEKDYLVDEDALYFFGEDRKVHILKEGSGFAIIKEDGYYKLLIKGDGCYYGTHVCYPEAERGVLDALCLGDWSVLKENQELSDNIIQSIALDLDLLDVIPNSLYLHIPNFAQRLQTAVKLMLYSQYEKCSTKDIDGVLVKAEQYLNKVSAYIEKQEKGKAAIDLLTGEKETEVAQAEPVEADDKTPVGVSDEDAALSGFEKEDPTLF